MKVSIVLLLLSCFTASATETSNWLTLVSPILSAREKAAYLALSPDARQAFQMAFWNSKNISEADYLGRVQDADAKFGSGRTGSGFNTDQGRVFISLGAPNHITRLPSSRSFYPLEIWYYESVPALHIGSTLRLLFYLKNGLGEPKLYSPAIDRITSLMTPQSGTVGMFGPNQTLNDAAVQTQLSTRPVENEIAEAAVSVAQGVMGIGNQELLALTASPIRALTQQGDRTSVQSRLLLGRSHVQSLETPSTFGGRQVDLCFQLQVQHSLNLEVRQNGVALYRSSTQLSFDRPKSIRYSHRLDLLPGEYSLIVTTDATTSAYPLRVGTPIAGAAAEIVFGEVSELQMDRPTPFRYAGQTISPATEGRTALVPASGTAAVNWILRRGAVAVWKTKTVPQAGVALLDLPIASFPPAHYTLEAEAAGGTFSSPLDLPLLQRDRQEATVSFNANLSTDQRYNFIAHQWIAQGRYADARQALQRSLQAAANNNKEALVELSRVDALQGHYDASRARLQAVLKAQPNHFIALTTLACVEAGLQDYPQAAALYRQALRVQESPAVRLALLHLPEQ